MVSLDRIGFNAFWWEKLWDEKAIGECAGTLTHIGYKAVEYKLASFDPEKKRVDELKRAVDLSSKEGIAVSNFVILRDVVKEEGREKGIVDVLDTIDAVAASGINKLNLVTGGMPPAQAVGEGWWVPKQEKLERAWCNLLSAFEQFVRRAEECKVYLVVEAVVGQIVHDYYSTCEFMRHFDSEYLALTLDPSHYLLYRNDISWAVSQWGEKIKHVHVKDAVGRPGEFGKDFLFPILGEGAIDWSGFFKALDQINYEGYLSVEFESFKYMADVLKNNPAKAAELGMDAIVQLLTSYLGSEKK